jgi:hypothetical protein
MGSRISLQNIRVTRIAPENTNNRSEIIAKHQGQSDLAAKSRLDLATNHQSLLHFTGKYQQLDEIHRKITMPI